MVGATSRWTVDRGMLRRGEDRVLLMGGQVHNSSSSSRASIQESFAHVRRMNGNAVLAPVSWALSEPEEGRFDFDLVDHMIAEARAQGLRLVLLWFGAFKNAASTYAPRWVRADEGRFPRAVVEHRHKGNAFHYEGVTPTPVLSVFSPALREADATAFEALLAHLARADSDDVVAMVQIENESGILLDSRDRNALAEQAWAEPVPSALIRAASSGAEGSLMHELWVAGGRRDAGSWSEVFGNSSAADEVFMAWAIGSYVEHLAGRGQAIKTVPMYVNAWLGPQPGQTEPGQWPSGGPTSRVIDVWHAAAPSLALVAPDIYVDDAAAVMQTYAASQPLFVPESRLRAGELVRAVGTHRAIGWSGFGIDGANPEGQVAAVLAYVTAFEEAITGAQEDDRIAAVIVEHDEHIPETVIGDLRITARGLNSIVRNFLLDVGVQLPEKAVPVPDETLPGEPVPTAGETRPFALLFAVDDDTMIVIGQGVKIDVHTSEEIVEVDAVTELRISDGRLIEGRVLNGDERLQVVPVDRVGAARLTLLRRPVIMSDER